MPGGLDIYLLHMASRPFRLIAFKDDYQCERSPSTSYGSCPTPESPSGLAQSMLVNIHQVSIYRQQQIAPPLEQDGFWVTQ